MARTRRQTRSAAMKLDFRWRWIALATLLLVASAWVLAATAVLRQTAGEQAKQLIQQLLALSLQDGVADSVRCEAVLAIDVSSDPSVEPVLHEIFRTTAGDVKVEAVAALAVRSAVDDDERRFIRDLLDGAVLSGIVTLRKADLLSAIGT